MAKITFKGIEAYIRQLSTLGTRTEEISKKAIYEGAKIVADAVKEELQNLPTDESWGSVKTPAKGIKEEQKNSLLKSFGISSLQDNDDFLNVKLGFDGYNDMKSKGYPNGQPNALIARAAESGTSFSEKTPFMEPAVKRARKTASKQIKSVYEVEIEKIMKE